MLMQKICHKGLLYLQKIVSQSFSANCKSCTASKKLEHAETACLLSWMSAKETSAKNFIFTRRKIDKEELLESPLMIA